MKNTNGFENYLKEVAKEYKALSEENNTLLQIVYAGLLKEDESASYKELVECLKSYGMTDEQIKDMDFSFLRDYYINTHTYKVEDSSFTMMGDYGLEVLNVSRVRGIYHCSICGKETNCLNAKGIPVCSKICYNVQKEER